MIGPLKGRLRSQSFTEDVSPDPRTLEREFTAFLDKSTRLTRRVRVVVSIGLAVGLAFVASRVEQPLVIGVCGLVVLAPIVWLASAVLVPMSLIGRANLAKGAGITMQTGVPVAFGPQGVSVGEESFSWAVVSAIDESADGLRLHGVDVTRRVVFEIAVGPGSFESDEARRQVARAVQSLWREAVSPEAPPATPT